MRQIPASCVKCWIFLPLADLPAYRAAPAFFAEVLAHACGALDGDQATAAAAALCLAEVRAAIKI